MPPSHRSSKRAAPLLALALATSAVLSSCWGEETGTRRPTSGGGEQPTKDVSGQDAPAPDAPISNDPDRLARKINANERALMRDLRAWRKAGARLDDELVPDIKLRVLYQQRVTRRLARWEGAAERVLPQIEARAFYKANVKASRLLATLSGEPPKEIPKFRYARPEAPTRLQRYFAAGDDKFGVPRKILASVNFVETKFGRVLGPSSAGAKGPMQFLESTWDAYGGGGDIWDPHDAIIGAARYLNASGAPARMRDALYAYNPSDIYVDVVLIYTRQMRRVPLRFFDYYFWQVFIRTKDGVYQATGPGSPRI